MAKTIIFDLDGTILNTLDDLCDSVNYALGYYDYPLRSIDEVKSFVGDGIGNLISRSIPSNEDSLKVLEVFKKHYQKHSKDKTTPYHGIIETIVAFRKKGYTIACITNKSDKLAQNIVNFYFDNLFDYVIGERPNVKRKPCKEVFETFISLKKIKRKECIYIGDSDVDIEFGKNCGIRTILVSYGFREKDFLVASGAKEIVDSPKELLEVIEKSTEIN